MLQIQLIKKTTVDIILPAYNPPAQWESGVINSYRHLSEKLGDGFLLNLIIVNDGSSKDLNEEVKKIKDNIDKIIFIDNQINQGKGHALKTGVGKSQAPFIIYTDIDFPYQQDSMIKMINALISGKQDIVVGIRDQSYYQNIPRQRLRISKILKAVNKKLFRLPTADTQAGLKGMTSEVKNLFINLKTNRYLIDLEFLKQAKRNKYTFKLIEIKLREDAILTKMHFKTLVNEFGSFLKILLS